MQEKSRAVTTAKGLRTRETILDAAELVFSEKGYERTSMDDIARTAALSRALLYVYFKDKAAIHSGMEKVQTYEEAFAKIQAATGASHPLHHTHPARTLHAPSTQPITRRSAVARRSLAASRARRLRWL